MIRTRGIFAGYRQVRLLSLSGQGGILRPATARMGWSKEVISDLLPFTSELITNKGRPFENIAVGYCNPLPPKLLENGRKAKRIDDSWLEIIFPFSDHKTLRESMSRNDGKTIRYGKLFEILDAVAADVSYRHCDGIKQNSNHLHDPSTHVDLVVVTAAVDGVRASANIDITNDLKLQGYLTYVGSSSMEITIDMITVNKDDGVESKIGETQFIMVARDPNTGKATPIYQLILDNDVSKQKFESGRERANVRKAKAQTSLSLTPPKTDEVDLIHKLYLESKQYKLQKDELISQTLSRSGTGMDQGIKVQPTFTKFKWMKNTVFKSTLLMHVQDRNIHGKIFGGYIMKEAFELAWVAAVCFTGHKSPIFTSVDDIQFVKPVNIGSCMEFVATVIYSENNKIVIMVKAYDVDVTLGTRSKTNMLTYVFSAPDGVNTATVMPKEYEEYVLFLEGRRSLHRLMSN